MGLRLLVGGGAEIARRAVGGLAAGGVVWCDAG